MAIRCEQKIRTNKGVVDCHHYAVGECAVHGAACMIHSKWSPADEPSVRSCDRCRKKLGRLTIR